MPDLQRKRYNDENRDAILQFVEAGGDGNDEGIVLSDKQIELYQRWDFTAQKIRERKYKREQIANFIIGTFKVSRDTAYKDIVNAEYVFAASCPLNKKFITQQRIELLQMKINECYIANDYFSAAQLEKILQKYIESYPDEKPLRSPKTIIFNVQNNNNTLMMTNMTEEEAMKDIDAFINNMENQDDF